jgi:enoyl-CoA hydratase
MQTKNTSIVYNNNWALLTIERPEKLNALNIETIQELNEVFKSLDENKAIRAIVLTGSGTKAFVAGADISEFAHFDKEEGTKLAAEGQRLLFDFVENLSTPVIAAINGFALGGGLELAMSCHFRIASTNAKMGLPEVTLGVIPGYGGTQRLAQLVGKGKAMEMIITASMIDANQAFNDGLVNHVVAQEDLLTLAETLALKIANNAPLAVSKAMQSLLANYKHSVNGYDVEIENFGACFATKDFKEGTSAFLEKRKAVFVGE